MAQDPPSQRTEKPTPKRLQKAREMGQIARSPEIPGALALIGFLVFCRLFGSDWLLRLQGMLTSAFASLRVLEMTPETAFALLRSTLGTTAVLLAPPLAVLAAAGVAGNLVQGPPLFSLKPLAPRWERLHALGNLKRVFALRSWVEVLKILLKIALYGAVALSAARQAVLQSAGDTGASATLRGLFDLAGMMIARIAMLALALAALDYLYRRYDHQRSLRMTKQEVTEERKEHEVSPLVRQRIRSRMLTLARSRMMSEVPKATVVVTNPTHVAVALRYAADEGGVPRVVAKGRNLIAARIRALAAAHQVPIVEDPPLARSLYRLVPLGRSIPTALFRAVAEVLALVLTNDRRRAAASGRRPSPEEITT
ncbi:MAG TPA: EscU/YscU/HrcU family type III secretion system export apparatus switch protein [Candidatus Polarisedimenticolia bacterium]|nr:EscU/YscU/HrcU family type III secretion system export apparatus switch protein [Candidatus Polarisedimenticolia bacterium]